MKHLQFKVNSQTLKRLDSFKPAAGSVNYLTASFEFSEDWSGTAKTAKCRKDNAIYSAAINSSGVCVIPHEVLTQDKAKRAFGVQDFYISVEGVNGATTITTAEIKIDLSLTSAGEEMNVSDPTPELYAQYIADVKAATKENADTAAEAAASATASAASMMNNYANALKGKASGAVVRVDDVAPVEHFPVVKVHGKNIIPFPYYNMGGEINGITYTVNNDGSVTAKGTATANAALYLTKGLANIKGNVFLSGCPNGGSITASSGGGFSLRMNKFVNGVEVTGGADVGSGNRITLNGEEIRIYIVVLSGKTVDCTFYPMLSYGEAATEYTPYIDPATITLTRCGKNIHQCKAKTQTINGVTFTVNADGSVTANGTATKATFIGLGALSVKAGEKYRLSGSPAGSDFDTYLLYIHNNTTGGDIYDLGSGKVFTATAGDNGLTIAVYANTTVNNLLFKPMVVYGEEIEAFEPYNGATYTPETDGTIDGLTSVSPTMTLLSDHEGVTIDCEYNRDINKAFARLEALLNN